MYFSNINLCVTAMQLPETLDKDKQVEGLPKADHVIKMLLKVLTESLVSVLIQEGKRNSKRAILHWGRSHHPPDYIIAIQTLLTLKVCINTVLSPFHTRRYSFSQAFSCHTPSAYIPIFAVIHRCVTGHKTFADL